MGYRIEYDRGTQSFEIEKDSSLRFPVLVFACFCIFLLLCSWFWPEGISFIRDVIIPGDDAVTVQALENLTAELRAGTAWREAVTAFCHEVLRVETGIR